MQPDLRDERRAVSSGKTVSSFVRSAVHVVDSLRARLPSLFDRRVFPTTFFSFVLSSFAASVSLFPFRSRFTSCALYAPRLVSLEKSPRLVSLQTISASIVFPCRLPLFYQRSPLSLCPRPASARTFSPFLFHPISPPSRPLSRPFVISLQPSRVHFCFPRALSAIVFLSPSQTLEGFSLQRHSLRRVLFLQPSFSLSLSSSTTLSMPCLFLPFSL